MNELGYKTRLTALQREGSGQRSGGTLGLAVYTDTHISSVLHGAQVMTSHLGFQKKLPFLSKHMKQATIHIERLCSEADLYFLVTNGNGILNEVFLLLEQNAKVLV